MVHVEEERLEDPVEELDAADRDRADGVAVVAAAERHELGARGVAAELVVLERHLERDLHRGRAGVGEEDAGEARRAGARTSSSAHSIDAVEARPSRVEWATRSSCARTASSISGTRWPCTLHQSDDTPSR